ncbi:hemolysin family protein [Halorubrum sp. AD140]|uniref:hemolysin family protein n=1 Tax=Halorubrum sp. AD140 TaxID=3050073 RepID=UPI002ACCE036|nr:hemolysin family protein [Halorubrum sp. AD140]MDZ5810674.1 hemolysin family protein [Halorubrum sp. AD140]
MDITIAFAGVAAILVLTGISAFFSSSELAVFSVASHRVDSLVAADVPGARALSALRADSHRFLVTALVSNNVANIAAASVATAVFVRFGFSGGEAATGSTLVTSVFVIVFGEIAPKSYAVANAEKHALRVSRPVVAIQRVIRPVLYVFEALSGVVNRFTGGESDIESYLTREEIETLVLSGQAAGAIDPEEGAMIRGVLDLESTRVSAVMVPRTDMVALPDTATPADVLSTAGREGVTRMPIYGENRDDVVGIVDVRDAIGAHERGEPLSSALRDPTFVPETQPVDELFAELRSSGRRLAIVVDEFGAVVGIVTLADVVEEIVGELVGRWETNHVDVVAPDAAVVRGWTTVAHLNETLGLDLPVDGGVETVAGLITQRVGRIATEGDRVAIGGVTLTVTGATPTRVTRIRVEHPGVDGDAAGSPTAAAADANGGADDEEHDEAEGERERGRSE